MHLLESTDVNINIEWIYNVFFGGNVIYTT